MGVIGSGSLLPGVLSVMLAVALSGALAVCVAAAAIRFGVRAASGLRTIAVALLLPGLALALWPAAFWGAGPDGLERLACRAVGTLPLLVLPMLVVLARMPPGQARAAAGLGAGRAARLRLLWLPLLGPVCLVGLVLTVLVDAASLHHARSAHRFASVVLFPSASPS